MFCRIPHMPSFRAAPRGHSPTMTSERRLRNARGFLDPPNKVPWHSTNAHPRMHLTDPLLLLFRDAWVLGAGYGHACEEVTNDKHLG